MDEAHLCSCRIQLCIAGNFFCESTMNVCMLTLMNEVVRRLMITMKPAYQVLSDSNSSFKMGGARGLHVQIRYREHYCSCTEFNYS